MAFGSPGLNPLEHARHIVHARIMPRRTPGGNANGPIGSALQIGHWRMFAAVGGVFFVLHLIEERGQGWISVLNHRSRSLPATAWVSYSRSHTAPSDRFRCLRRSVAGA